MRLPSGPKDSEARIAGFLYRLCGPNGSDLGDYPAAIPDMQGGDILYADGWPKWRVRAAVSTEGLRGDVYAAMLEVEATS